MERTFCFGCGAEMSSAPGQVAPTCPSCQQGGARQDGEGLWVVRHVGQRPQGPLTRDVVEERILRNLVGPDDEVARKDGPWQAFNIHPDFRSWFTPGHPFFDKREQALASRQRGRSKRAWGARAKALGAIVGMVAVGGLTYLAIETRSTVIPEPWIETTKDKWHEFSSRFLDTVEVATTDVDKQLQRVELVNLPADDLIAELAQSSPVSDEPARLHLLRGRDRLMKEITDAPEAAIAELELAAIAAPRDVMAIAALAEIYGLAGKFQPAKADQALELLNRAERISQHVPAVLRARAVLAMGSGSYDNARRIADDCISQDPDNIHCRYYKGISLLALERYEDAQSVLSEVYERAPHVPRFRLALCQAAVESGRYRKAREMTDAFVDEYGHVAEGYGLSSRLAWLTADYDRALRDAQKATRLDDGDMSSRLLAAELLLASGELGKAEATLQPLLDDESIRSHKQAARIYTVGSHIQREQGKLESALALARVAVEIRPHWTPPAYALGSALALTGELAAAERIFMDAQTEDLRPVEAGRFYVKLGHVYREQHRSKAAMTAYERAIEQYPESEEARLGMVEVYLELGNMAKAIDMLRSISGTDFEQNLAHPPNSLLPIEPMDVRPLAAALRQAIADDIRFNKNMDAVEGALAYHAGEYEIAEHALRKALDADDTDDISRAYLARVKMRQRAYFEAEGVLTRLLATPGNEGLYSAMLGICRSRAGRSGGALSELERVAKLVSNVPAAHRLYAEALYRDGKIQEARDAARNAYTLDDLDHHARRLVLLEGDEDL